jgi:hypothetical protein
MTVPPTFSVSPSIRYPQKTVLRAERAIRCAPLQLRLFEKMVSQSIPLMAIANSAGVQNQYTQKNLSEFAVESELLWLIRVGVLRREVDGQGLTDSFRVTPLGRQLVEQWQQERLLELSSPSLSDLFYNALSRWLRISLN